MYDAPVVDFVKLLLIKSVTPGSKYGSRGIGHMDCLWYDLFPGCDPSAGLFCTMNA